MEFHIFFLGWIVQSTTCKARSGTVSPPHLQHLFFRIAAMVGQLEHISYGNALPKLETFEPAKSTATCACKSDHSPSKNRDSRHDSWPFWSPSHDREPPHPRKSIAPPTKGGSDVRPQKWPKKRGYPFWMPPYVKFTNFSSTPRVNPPAFSMTSGAPPGPRGSPLPPPPLGFTPGSSGARGPFRTETPSQNWKLANQPNRR